MISSGSARSNPILVTGSHRSGSTWVGRMIAEAPTVCYLHEPFNPDAFLPGICELKFEREFTYVCSKNANDYRRGIERRLQFKYGLVDGLAAVRSPKDAMRLGRDMGRSAVRRLTRARPLMKDPHAIFSAPWLSHAFDMDVVVLIRHPAAFVGSIKKAKWAFRFGQLLEQPLLMQQHLEAFRSQITAAVERPADIIDQGILLWNLIYHVIERYRDRHPEWIFVRHEDLSRDPGTAFRNIFSRLGLDYTGVVASAVADHSGPSNPREQHGGCEIRRNSSANIRNWERRLTLHEIRRVREGTATVASHFYSPNDW